MNRLISGRLRRMTDTTRSSTPLFPSLLEPWSCQPCFFREFLGVPKEKALVPLLTCAAYPAWLCLGLSVVFGLLYSWLSVKWIKQAWGQPTLLSERSLERMMDWSFVLMIVLFLVGVGASVWFFCNSSRWDLTRAGGAFLEKQRYKIRRSVERGAPHKQ